MSETVATIQARQRARAVVGWLNGDIVPLDRKKAGKKPGVSATVEGETGQSGSKQPPCAEAAPLRAAPHGGEPAASEGSRPRSAAPLAGEVELKLLVDADHLQDFDDVPAIVTNARNSGTRRKLTAVYYDTPERTLWRNGLTLRVRQNGARFSQTVKAELRDDPLRRGEWEASVASFAPDVALAMPFIPDEIHPDLERRQLEAVFTAEIRRHERIVDLPSGTVAVAVDRGLLKAGDRSMPVSEIELELTGGSPAAVYELELRLAEHGLLRPSIRSKAARGFDLAADTSPAARRPRKLRLDPAIPLDDAFAAILRSCLQHLLESLPAAEDGRDPEGIHQLRVALRRLRSAFDLMRSTGSLSPLDSLRAEAKWLAQSLSAARDWDIFQSGTLPTIAQGCPSIAGFDALGRVAEERRSAAYREARLALADRRCALLVIGLGGWIEARGWRSDVDPERLRLLAEPASSFACRILAERHRKVLRRGRHFKSMTPEERHRLRLAVKKLRYLGEFLLPLHGRRKSTRRFSDKLADLQEELGLYNDMATTAALLLCLGAERSNGANAAAAIAGWQAHAVVGLEARLRNAWRQFAETKPPWSTEAEA